MPIPRVDPSTASYGPMAPGSRMEPGGATDPGIYTSPSPSPSPQRGGVPRISDTSGVARNQANNFSNGLGASMKPSGGGGPASSGIKPQPAFAPTTGQGGVVPVRFNQPAAAPGPIYNPGSARADTQALVSAGIDPNLAAMGPQETMARLGIVPDPRMDPVDQIIQHMSNARGSGGSGGDASSAGQAP